MTRLFAIIMFFLAAFSPLMAQTFPTLTGRVVDNANLIDPITRTAIEKKSADLEAKTTDQLVIVTINSLEGYEVADYINRLFRHWKLGQKDKNNGVLILIAKNERKIRIEVGYGLEGTLTDAVSKYIIQGAIVPRAKLGDYSGALSRATDDIITTLTGDKEEMARRAARPAKQEQFHFEELLPLLFFALIIFIFVMQMRSASNRRTSPFNQINNRSNNNGWVIIPSGGSSWGGGDSGGGFSGGGGSSGGGGASGDF
jgi:uncharacterized protein